MQHAAKSSHMTVVEECFWGKNCSPCAGVTGQGNHFEFIPAVSTESKRSTGVPTCHDFPRFVIISEKLRPEVGNRWLWSSKNGGFLGKKYPLRANFHKCFPKPHMRTRKHVFLCKFREIWPTGSRWNCALFNGQEKKFRLALPLPLLRGSRPKFVRDSSKQHARRSPNFIQIRSLPAEL